jgi:hypothetical protein
MRTALSKGSAKLRASLPEDESRAGFRNVAVFFKLYDGQSPKKGDSDMSPIPTSKLCSVEFQPLTP